MNPIAILASIAVAFFALNIAFAPVIYRAIFRDQMRGWRSDPAFTASFITAIPQLLVLGPLLKPFIYSVFESSENQPSLGLFTVFAMLSLFLLCNYLYIRSRFWIEREQIKREPQSVGITLFVIAFYLFPFVGLIVADTYSAELEFAPTNPGEQQMEFRQGR